MASRGGREREADQQQVRDQVREDHRAQQAEAPAEARPTLRQGGEHLHREHAAEIGERSAKRCAAIRRPATGREAAPKNQREERGKAADERAETPRRPGARWSRAVEASDRRAPARRPRDEEREQLREAARAHRGGASAAAPTRQLDAEQPLRRSGGSAPAPPARARGSADSPVLTETLPSIAATTTSHGSRRGAAPRRRGRRRQREQHRARAEASAGRRRK
jgi:hypothetical protein